MESCILQRGFKHKPQKVNLLKEFKHKVDVIFVITSPMPFMI